MGRFCFFVLAAMIACSSAPPGGTVPRGERIKGMRLLNNGPTRIYLPRDYRLDKPRHEHSVQGPLVIDLYARQFVQGNALYIEIRPVDAAPVGALTLLRILVNGREVLFSRRDWGYRVLTAIHPDTRPGVFPIDVSYRVGDTPGNARVSIPVAAAGFSVNYRAMDLGRHSDVEYRPTAEEQALIDRCAVKKGQAFRINSPDRLAAWLAHPRDTHMITSPFWARRFIMRYRRQGAVKKRLEDRLNLHQGIDLRGDAGAPIRAMADGVVVIAEPMYYEGNFVVVDHGCRVFSYFMHLRDFAVKEGDTVRAGDLLGTVGSTGLSTAAHLHVSLSIDGVQVEPLSLLSLPVRD